MFDRYPIGAAFRKDHQNLIKAREAKAASDKSGSAFKD
jgi:hypothetical protein